MMKLFWGGAARGRQAVLTDPQGAPFAVIASSRGDPRTDKISQSS
jgi:hypothetical protein